MLAKKYTSKNNNGILHSAHKTTVYSKGFIKKKTQVYNLVLEQDLNKMDIDKVSDQLIGLMSENLIINAKSKLDIGIALKKKNNLLRLTLVSLVHNKQFTTHIFN